MFQWLIDLVCCRRRNRHNRRKGDCGEYRRGEFLVKDHGRAEQLIKHDQKARMVYEGIESQIDRLKKITGKIKEKKNGKCRLEPEDA